MTGYNIFVHTLHRIVCRKHFRHIETDGIKQYNIVCYVLDCNISITAALDVLHYIANMLTNQ